MVSSVFLFAGKAEFEVRNNKNESYIFRIRKSRNADHIFNVVCVRNSVYHKFGGEYLGYINMKSSTLAYCLQKANRSIIDDMEVKPVKVFNWALAMIVNEKELPEGYSVNHVGKCGHCGKRLTNEFSKLIGLGPTCLKTLENHLTSEQKLIINFKKLGL